MTGTQLTIDGREVTACIAAGRRILTGPQREILRWVAAHDEISPLQAGAIVHAHREPPCRNIAGGARGRGVACCPWTSSDGSEALKRLVARGLLERRGRGRYGAVGRPRPNPTTHGGETVCP